MEYNKFWVTQDSVDLLEGQKTLQRNLNRLYQCTEDSCMKFSMAEVLPLDHNNMSSAAGLEKTG